MRFKLTIEYNGTRYSGWQIQKNARTVAGDGVFISRAQKMIRRRAWARGCPYPVAGRSLRASCPPLTRRKPRFALTASLGFLRRSIGTGSPSLRHRSHVKTVAVIGFRRLRCRDDARG